MRRGFEPKLTSSFCGTCPENLISTTKLCLKAFSEKPAGQVYPILLTHIGLKNRWNCKAEN